MAIEWLRIRILEEQERRKREEQTLQRLPLAMEELHGLVNQCLADYTTAFGGDSAEVERQPGRLKICAREQENGKWQDVSQVDVVAVPEIPGIRIERGESSLAIEIGLLPSDKLYYRDCEQDAFLTVEDLTRRILDRALFPKLRE
jgi:hypothetical protein